MIKNTLLALAAVATIATGAAPAFASSDSLFGTDRDFGKQTVLNSLQARGIQATDVEEWGTYIRAFVKQPDGTVKSELFQPVTLAPVTKVTAAG